MENYLITINGVKTVCTAQQKKLVEYYLSEYCGKTILDMGDCMRVPTGFVEGCQTFDMLNSPTDRPTDVGSPVASYFGDIMTNQEADEKAVEDFGVYFSALCWMDGCEDAFRTTPEISLDDFENFEFILISKVDGGKYRISLDTFYSMVKEGVVQSLSFDNEGKVVI